MVERIFSPLLGAGTIFFWKGTNCHKWGRTVTCCNGHSFSFAAPREADGEHVGVHGDVGGAVHVLQEAALGAVVRGPDLMLGDLQNVAQ